MKLVCFLVFCLCCQYSIAQCNNTVQYGEEEKESFVRIYLNVKELKPIVEVEGLYQLAKEYGVTSDQFRAIQKEKLDVKQLNDDEMMFVGELQKLKDEYEQALKDITREQCIAYKQDFQRYEEMKQQYLSCMKFQRSLSDYFKKWMN